MTKPTIQFRCPDDLYSSLTEREWEGQSANEAARLDLQRYYNLIRYALADLDLTEGEASLICDAMNGCWMWDITTPSQARAHIGMEVEDHIRLNGAAKKWGVDSDKLLGVLRSLPDWHAMALLDAVSRFWRQEGATLSSVGLVRGRVRLFADGQEVDGLDLWREFGSRGVRLGYSARVSDAATAKLKTATEIRVGMSLRESEPVEATVKTQNGIQSVDLQPLIGDST